MNRVLSILMAAFVLAANVGAAPVPNHPRSLAKPKTTTSNTEPRPYQIGSASWYGKKFHGKETASGDDFKLGIVLHDGERAVPFGDRLFAAPISCLWG